MSDGHHKKPDKKATRDGETGRNGRDAVLDRGFAALRQLRESTKAEALPERLRTVIEKLRRQS